MDGDGRCGTPAESEAAAGVAGRPAVAVCGNPKACCEPTLAVAAEDAGRGGSWERRVNSRATRDNIRPPVGRPLSLHSWMSCVLSTESRSALRRSDCVAIGMPEKRTLNFEWHLRAEHAANTAIHDSVSAVELRVCFVCACLPAYFRYNRNDTLIARNVMWMMFAVPFAVPFGLLTLKTWTTSNISSVYP